jgi:hypothetical protein
MSGPDRDGGTNDHATLAISSVSVDTDTITAVYSDDPNFAISTSSELSQVVQKSTSAFVPALESGVVDQVLGSMVTDHFSGLSASASLRSAYFPSRRRAAAPAP